MPATKTPRRLWLGSGITSRFAAFEPARIGVGYAEASQLFGGGGGVFMGQSVAAMNEAVLIRATLLGDTDLNAIVDGVDFINWNSHKFGPGDWLQGDFNYDGIVDGQDFIHWNNNKFLTFDLRRPPLRCQ